MLINNFRGIWAKPSKMKSFSSESQQYQYLKSCCVFQCSWFPQGHSQSWGVAIVRRGCTMLGPAGSLGASVITHLIKGKTIVQQPWEKTMRKKKPWEKHHGRHQGQGRRWRRRTGCNSLSPCHGLPGGEGGRKTRKKGVNLSLKEAAVLVLFLTILFFY